MKANLKLIIRMDMVFIILLKEKFTLGIGIKLKFINLFLKKRSNGLMEGEGELIWPNGKKYKGQFKKDKQHGYGEVYEKNGRIIKGWFVNGELHG